MYACVCVCICVHYVDFVVIEYLESRSYASNDNSMKEGLSWSSCICVGNTDLNFRRKISERVCMEMYLLAVEP